MVLDDDCVFPVNEQRILQSAPHDNLKAQLHRYPELNPLPCGELGQMVAVDQEEHVGAANVRPVQVDEEVVTLLFQEVIFFALTNPRCRVFEGNLQLYPLDQLRDIVAVLV